LKISNFQNAKPHEKTKNSPEKSKYITQKSYRRHPTAKKTDSKLKKAEKTDHPPPHYFNRTVPATTEPGRKKISTVPPSAPTDA
jgi:hypothetical protein